MLNNRNNKERRNYYRILNVQPDAPVEIIKNNYRTLLQKLRLHPDLGGEHWNASVINEAYNTLRDPVKRTAYDQDLLKCYELHSLSQGNLNKKASRYRVHKKDRYGNQRNFYRLLNIQPDAPFHIIKTSYLSLSKKSKIPKELLNDAYYVLGNSDKRALYDRLLTQYCHADAVNKLINKTLREKVKLEPSTSELIVTKARPHPVKTQKLQSTYKHLNDNYYQPVITKFCSFCKTPHAQSPCKDTAPLCNECNSPLFPPSAPFMEQQRRNLVRLTQRDSSLKFYTFWPGKPYSGKIIDVSPVGIQLQTSLKLHMDQTIKLDAEDFKAVGIVSNNRRGLNDGTTDTESFGYGIKFLTVNFNKQRGQFFSASA